MSRLDAALERRAFFWDLVRDPQKSWLIDVDVDVLPPIPLMRSYVSSAADLDLEHQSILQ
jgi:hypothetical protein